MSQKGSFMTRFLCLQNGRGFLTFDQMSLKTKPITKLQTNVVKILAVIADHEYASTIGYPPDIPYIVKGKPNSYPPPEIFIGRVSYVCKADI